PARERGRLNVLGATPMDLSCTDTAPLRRALEAEGWREVALLGMDATLDDVRRAGAAERSLVVSPSGLAAARWLERRFGVPYDVGYPLAHDLVPERSWEGARVLVVHQQVAADAIRRVLLARGAAEVTCATFFKLPEECRRAGDVALRDEADFAQAAGELAPDVILADAVLRPLVPGFSGAFFDETHFALSGHLASFGEVGPCE
ncbi:MAG: nitrogenase component 1, partial [Olsenella sp.]|nr:nitrogenase component 1 [Olsenella sp.]